MTSRDEDLFDFSEQIFGESVEERNEESKEKEKKPVSLTQENEIQTSYLLVNALLNLLIRKGIIYPHEVNAIIAELHTEYMQKKRGHAE